MIPPVFSEISGGHTIFAFKDFPEMRTAPQSGFKSDFRNLESLLLLAVFAALKDA